MKSKNERILLALITFLFICEQGGRVQARPNPFISRRTTLERKNSLNKNDKVMFFFPNELETKVNDFKINPVKDQTLSIEEVVIEETTTLPLEQDTTDTQWTVADRSMFVLQHHCEPGRKFYCGKCMRLRRMRLWG